MYRRSIRKKNFDCYGCLGIALSVAISWRAHRRNWFPPLHNRTASQRHCVTLDHRNGFSPASHSASSAGGCSYSLPDERREADMLKADRISIIRLCRCHHLANLLWQHLTGNDDSQTARYVGKMSDQIIFYRGVPHSYWNDAIINLVPVSMNSSITRTQRQVYWGSSTGASGELQQRCPWSIME